MKNTNSLLNDAWVALSKNKAALISAATMAVMIIMVLFGPIFSPYTIDETDWYKISAAPSLLDGHIFGTDDLGRDLFVRSNVWRKSFTYGWPSCNNGKCDDRRNLWSSSWFYGR